YRRYQVRPQTMLSPLTGLVDAARPDSDAAREFSRDVDALLADAPRFEAHASDLENTLVAWRDAGSQLEALMDGSPALAEAKPLAGDLSRMGAAGLEALSYLTKGVAPSAAWRDSRLAVLDEAAKPKAALEFPVVASVRELVVAASELPQLKSASPADWRKRVKQLAAPVKK
ncbi:MAG: hypothetical protein LC746_17765, partial [Acidobacteria bacterium]|nr:hypothetical protein [Acidobacteriota bacterium]